MEAGSWCDAEALRIDTLIDWLSSYTSRAPIRPMDIFDLNYASGASITGLILTYMIILLQFKGHGQVA